jgi:hypothetical protein
MISARSQKKGWDTQSGRISNSNCKSKRMGIGVGREKTEANL